MKKLLCVSTAAFILASCGNPVINSPDEALQKSQSEFVEILETFAEMTPPQAKSIGDITINAQAEGATLNGDIKYDFVSDQEKNETSGNLDVNMELKSDDQTISPIGNIAGKVNLDLMTLKEKILFKLNELKIDGADENPELAMASAFTAPFQGNWYFIDLPEDMTVQLEQDMLAQYKEMIQILKMNTLLSHVSTIENENFYEYEVQIHIDNVIKATQEFLALNHDESLTLSEKEIEKIRKELQQINDGTLLHIKIDKKDLEYFVFSLVDKSNEENKIIFENSETNINLEAFLPYIHFSFHGTKKENGLASTFEITHPKKEGEIIEGSLNIEINGNNSSLILEATVQDEYMEEPGKLHVEIHDTTTKHDVIITEPSDAKNFQEVIMQIMGGMMGNPESFENEYNIDSHSTPIQ